MNNKSELNVIIIEKNIISNFEEILIKYKSSKDESDLDKLKGYVQYLKNLAAFAVNQKDRHKELESDITEQIQELFDIISDLEILISEKKIDEKKYNHIMAKAEKFKIECNILSKKF